MCRTQGTVVIAIIITRAAAPSACRRAAGGMTSCLHSAHTCRLHLLYTFA